jgi:hypothetical protein
MQYNVEPLVSADPAVALRRLFSVVWTKVPVCELFKHNSIALVTPPERLFEVRKWYSRDALRVENL